MWKCFIIKKKKKKFVALPHARFYSLSQSIRKKNVRIKAFSALPLEIRHAADSQLISRRALPPMSEDTEYKYANLC